MARERCAGCSGSGRGINGRGPCTFCGGTGSIWVPDKPKNYGPVGGYGGGSSRGLFSSASSVEELLASLLTIGAFGYTIYYGYSEGWEWYWPIIVGFIAGILTYYLFMGPLRFILILAKWLIILGMIALLIWGTIQLWDAFSAT